MVGEMLRQRRKSSHVKGRVDIGNEVVFIGNVN